MITALSTSTDQIPAIMPSPFAYQPHPLAQQAAELLQQKLSRLSCEHGKMFGVLVIRNSSGEIGFLSAFSGMFNGMWTLPGFVPPIFNQCEQNSFLPAAKDELNRLADHLEALENSTLRSDMKQQIEALKEQCELNLNRLKQQYREAKAERKQQRIELNRCGNQERIHSGMHALALASQHQKQAITHAKRAWLEKIETLQSQLDLIEAEISEIRSLRKAQSRHLHRRVFDTYQLTNKLSEQRSINHFFKGATPPAGSGDCAGPKLIHYALTHQLQPLAMAEFWWGPSPSTGVRHHGQFYPACRGKCRPILPFMLAGIELESEPDFAQKIAAEEPQTVFEDASLIVLNKPAGLLSVPGREIKDSVYNRLLQRYPEHPQLRLVHRLDMATSGLLLVAKNLQINKALQKQFIQRRVEKRYEALLQGKLEKHSIEGEISLPLSVDMDDHPRQMVCYESGREAVTGWKVIGGDAENTRIWFYPLTGRTHQLRVHASHAHGLNAAIIGDALYGQPAERLMLHAQRLCFDHPLNRQRMVFEIPTPF